MNPSSLFVAAASLYLVRAWHQPAAIRRTLYRHSHPFAEEQDISQQPTTSEFVNVYCSLQVDDWGTETRQTLGELIGHTANEQGCIYTGNDTASNLDCNYFLSQTLLIAGWMKSGRVLLTHELYSSGAATRAHFEHVTPILSRIGNKVDGVTLVDVIFYGPSVQLLEAKKVAASLRGNALPDPGTLFVVEDFPLKDGKLFHRPEEVWKLKYGGEGGGNCFRQSH